MRAVVAMPSGDQHQKRVALPVAGDVEHGRQPSATGPERRVFRVEGPFLRRPHSASGTPLAC